MPAIASKVIVESDDFRANRIAHLELIAEFRALERKVREASARSDAKFRARGQLPPRERINLLLDRDAPFLELSSLCGLGMHEDDIAKAVDIVAAVKITHPRPVSKADLKEVITQAFWGESPRF